MKRGIMVSTRVTIIVLVIILINTISIGVFSYVIHRADSIKGNSDRTMAIAKSTAMSIEPNEFRYALETNKKNEHYEHLRELLERVRAEEHLLYYYGGTFDPETGMVMYIEGHGDVFGLNGAVPLSIFPQAAFDAFESGEARVSDVYRLNIDGSWGVSAYAPILDENMKPIGLVGVLISLTEALARSNNFAFTMFLISLAVFFIIIWIPIIYIKRSVARPLFSLQVASNKIAQGDMDLYIPTRKTNDEVGMLSQNFSTMQEIVTGLHQEIKDLVENATSGNLSYRAHSDKYPGAWREVIDKFNDLMDTIMLPIDEAANTLHEIAGGDFSARIASEYKGDFDRIKKAVNSAAIDLDRYLTEKEEAESALYKAEQKANRAKSDFLSRMSHEMRTPMNAILGITEIQLQDEALNEEIKEAFNKISVSGDMLLGIINDILDLSKIEADKLELLTARYEIASLISDTALLNMMRIGSKPIEFELYVDEDTPAVLSGDELRVKQILNNILSNAFKYTESGTVKLAVSAEPDNLSSDNVTLVLAVSDTGQGMTSEEVALLFDEYSRFNMEANRSTEGTGLGMSITRNLISLMHGSISVDSEVGKGSTFTVRIPQGKTDSGVLGKEMVENLQNFRTSSRSQMKRVQISREPMPYGSVLIVDDVETNIYVARGLLAPYGLRIDSADSGFEAIDKIQKGHIYDIVFMDHMMPKMDGIEATKIIRDMGYTSAVVALTANAISGQADIFLGNGFDDFISKPIDIRQLNAVLNKLIRDKQPPEVIEAAKQQAAEQKENASGDKPQPEIDPHFVEIFVRDALRALAALEEVFEKNNFTDESNLRTYIINVHGIKSALANVGKMDLSAVAMKLEAAGREGKFHIITSETAAFLSALRSFVEELTPEEDNDISENTDEDKQYLRERLLVIKAACEDYDENAVDEALTQLRKASWSQDAKELLNQISEKLLHSDFDEIVDAINGFLEK